MLPKLNPCKISAFNMEVLVNLVKSQIGGMRLLVDRVNGHLCHVIVQNE